MKDGPFKFSLDKDLEEGVIRQELVTYRVKGGMLKKETVTRDYLEDGDYNDSSYSQPLMTMHWRCIKKWMVEFALVYMLGTIIISQDQTFRNVNDCLYFAKRLNAQPEIPFPNDKTKKITVYCKPVPKRVQNKK